MSEKRDRQTLIKALSMLGDAMVAWGENQSKSAFHPFVADPYYEKMNEVILSEHHHNGWFTESAVRESLLQLGKRLNEAELKEWLGAYNFSQQPKRVGLIMAGNIPLVGFHDFISTLIMGHKPVVKMSSDDKRILPVLIEILETLQPDLTNEIQLVDQLKEIDAVIATGSDNSARYFEKYFGHLPHIIRKNRTSVAIIEGDESTEELKELGKDVFTYYGLGCRNVSHIFFPKDFDLDRFFGAIIDYGDVINHNKYANNYDYYKAIYLMNQEDIIENGFLLTRESSDLFAPIAVIHYQRYDDRKSVQEYLKKHEDKIQVVAGKQHVPFGKAQSPKLDDYADGVNTLNFLSQL